ncbi:MAG: SDR family oxidoreductase [Candidatus Poseidoniaceae archaeon]|nr:pteridine reductase [Euryarchaeota archaeon]MBL6891059.1 SDR family oxidoreductase [Candidatus Poseidoniaceae archaeon]RAH06356.1 MAG: pteridine reductase [Euryarchaeota archaeon TMED132]|tara:strand:+ start:40526 stop:41272 length:747 start_codon:yes stop_codon:yes gene_type:complete
MSKPVVLITGAGKRIGAEVSKELMEMGWYVLIHVNSSVDSAKKILADYTSKFGVDAPGDILQANLLNDSEVKDLISQVLQHSAVQDSGGISGLIHNASIYSSIDVEEVSIEDLQKNMKLHVETPFNLTLGLLDSLKSKNGCVIGMVDTSLGRAWKGLSHYTASKAGLRQLMINFAGDFHPDVRVNCIAPGAIISADWEVEHFAKIIEEIPLGRSGHPSNIAKAVLFLFNSPHISGQVINVDGGWSLNQ